MAIDVNTLDGGTTLSGITGYVENGTIWCGVAPANAIFTNYSPEEVGRIAQALIVPMRQMCGMG